MALVTLSDTGGFEPLNVRGYRVERGIQTQIPALQALFRCSDKNLMFTFEEADRKDLESVDAELFPSVSLELGKTITTNKELVDLLLPKKTTTKKKTAPKTSKSSLVKE
jgi:hypothetical protein